MAVDTPAKIAILGAGPIGLEAALYARYLGYEVDLYERRRVAEHAQRLRHCRLFTPWSTNVTTLGLAALRAQDESWTPAADDALLTCGAFLDRYLEPLSKCDLLADCILEQTEVLGVGREGVLRDDLVGDDRRIDVPFRILVRGADGQERIERADVVIDCTGAAVPMHLGSGGLPAVGELACSAHIEYGVPDVLGADRDHYADRSTLVVGDDWSAIQTLAALAELSASAKTTEVLWITRSANGEDGPTSDVSVESWPARAALLRQVNELASFDGGPVSHFGATHVERVDYDVPTSKFAVELSGRHAGHRAFDRVVAAIGRRADRRLFAELNVTLKSEADRGDLIQVEPDVYVLGEKSYDGRGTFVLADGHDQIRRLFAIIGDREGLNLYGTMK